jgi:uncharacterized membrane protein
MKKLWESVVNAMVSGFLVIVPIYLAVLLLLKAMESAWALVRPFALVLPAWFPAENLLSLLLVLVLCFVIGVCVRTPLGRALRERIDSQDRLSVGIRFEGSGRCHESFWPMRSAARQVLAA